jgi:hypothetical protein
MNPIRSTLIPIRAVTHGPQHHFFGYYDRFPWDVSGRYLLAQQSTFMDRRPALADELLIGLIDLHDDNRFEPFASTRAWNWQQGCHLKWLNDQEIIYNDCDGERYISVIHNVETGAQRALSQPQYSITPDGQHSITLNFSRAYDIRAGYGYAAIADPWRDDNAPQDSGIWRQNLHNGEGELIISIRQIAEWGVDAPDLAAKHWLDHLFFNQDGSRFIFLHRWGQPRQGGGAWWKTRLFTAGRDGSSLYCLSDHEAVSHFDWRDPHTVLAWARRHDIGDRYFLFTDQSNHIEIVGEGVLTVDGHCTYSPDKQWILTDTYPDAEGFKTLILWNVQAQQRIDIGRFYGPMPADVDIRCDLHPRWSRDGQQVCIDSIHEGSRQMYVLDVSGIVG